MNDLIIQNIKQLILPKATERTLKGKELNDLNSNEKDTVVVKNGKIEYASKHSDAYDAIEIIYATEKGFSPALVEANTHLVHGGSREHEMSLKSQGVSYLEILEQGGGILSTVEATRQATEDELFEKAEKNLLTMLQHGVLAVESKSGYGL